MMWKDKYPFHCNICLVGYIEGKIIAGIHCCETCKKPLEINTRLVDLFADMRSFLAGVRDRKPEHERTRWDYLEID